MLRPEFSLVLHWSYIGYLDRDWLQRVAEQQHLYSCIQVEVLCSPGKSNKRYSITYTKHYSYCELFFILSYQLLLTSRLDLTLTTSSSFNLPVYRNIQSTITIIIQPANMNRLPTIAATGPSQSFSIPSSEQLKFKNVIKSSNIPRRRLIGLY